MRQKSCEHNNEVWQRYGVRVYTRPVRRMFRKRIWWVCPGCGAREKEVRRKHGKV